MTIRGRALGRIGWRLPLAGTLALVTLQCAPPAEAVQARQVALMRLKCAEDRVEMVLNRETPKVREWIVACDFIYSRIHCTDTGCYKADPEPPCMPGIECFEEDPVTLEWRLAERN